jgi:phage-related protein
MADGSVWRWPVTLGSSQTVDLSPLEVRFGEGYAQRVKQPNAARKRTFEVRCERRPVSEIQAMKAFLDSHGGADSFDFVERDSGQPYRVVCKGYTIAYSGHVYGDLSATFEVVREYP